MMKKTLQGNFVKGNFKKSCGQEAGGCLESTRNSEFSLIVCCQPIEDIAIVAAL
ncbi:hypothetical protein JWG39_09085 [Desulforhopalus vacuolatus]|uniref:hypothetical protein n=1 Tax=Desulforhopalus vacuolatus TaxID=40414 RepID=UPI0019623DF8|nr:hypothetical protein [Desulforhopalus vacuolatus]MBM9519969.1 hypothetical protein [Desulforhopalus vacuolatus]